uniref:biotin/lipoyl-binding protein n=1 Tax=Sphaerisporangium corydalis TaxID=1441875 RepID=UPI0021CEF8EC
MRSSTPPAAVRVGGLALAGIILVGAGLIYLGGGDGSPQARIELASARRGTVVSGVSAAGNTVDADLRDLAFGASGTVEKVYATVGQKVRKGQVLARIDDTIAREDYTAAEASLAAAEETRDNLEKAQAAGTTGGGSGSGGSGSGGSGGSGRGLPSTAPNPTGRPSTGPSGQPSGRQPSQPCPPTGSGTPRPSGPGGTPTPTPSAPVDEAPPPVGFTIRPSADMLAAAEVALTGPGAVPTIPAGAPTAPAQDPTPTPSP